MSDEKVIHVHIYDPRNSIFKGSKNDRAEAHIYSCSQSQSCDAYASGQCMMIAKIFGGRCIYGKRRNLSGFTPRARKYSSWILEQRERYTDKIEALKTVDGVIFKVEGGYMMPYSFMGMNESVPFHSHDGGFKTGLPFIKKEDITKENLASIYNFRPRAMMGGEIKDYQNKIVPKFAKDLSDRYPDLYELLVEAVPGASKLVEDYDYTGRDALLSTIKINCNVTISKKIWFWDGEFIIAKDKGYMIFPPVEWDQCELKFKPKANEKIRITSNDQVTPDTVFVD